MKKQKVSELNVPKAKSHHNVETRTSRSPTPQGSREQSPIPPKSVLGFSSPKWFSNIKEPNFDDRSTSPYTSEEKSVKVPKGYQAITLMQNHNKPNSEPNRVSKTKWILGIGIPALVGGYLMYHNWNAIKPSLSRGWNNALNMSRIGYSAALDKFHKLQALIHPRENLTYSHA